MKSVAVVAIGALSGLGQKEDAYRVADELGVPARCVLQHDPALASAGLRRPRAARAPLVQRPAVDRATDLLNHALDDAMAQLDRSHPHWREMRLGLCLGTSSGGMLSAESFFRARRAQTAPLVAADVEAVPYFAPFQQACQRLPAKPVACSQVVAACASSTLAIGLAMRWLDRGLCELVFAGGYDAISLFVASGFEALRATSPTAPAPFRRERRGMNLGEGAAVLALQATAPAARFYLSGFGAACDAQHITAPDRDAEGLVRAAGLALREAGEPEIGLVSPHATATAYNDAAEAKAIGLLCPRQPVVHPFKAEIGHTLGAAGALELCATSDAMQRRRAPAAAGEGEREASLPFRLLDRAEPADDGALLKLSAGFGGVTAALVASREDRPRQRPTPRRVGLARWSHCSSWDEVQLKAASGFAPAAYAKLDALSKLALAAATALGPGALPREAGVVAGHGLATLETNAAFFDRLLRRGAARADPRWFPATSPNAVAGQVAIALGLQGPNFSVNASLQGAWEALSAAAELVAAGDADEMLVVAVDDCGECIRQWLAVARPGCIYQAGAVAMHLRVHQSGDAAIELDRLHAKEPEQRLGHLSLLPWLSDCVFADR
jgi:3-oxoacyl-[acyl-carrier-protein] synthase II